jgi:hypothetical protein
VLDYGRMELVSDDMKELDEEARPGISGRVRTYLVDLESF